MSKQNWRPDARHLAMLEKERLVLAKVQSILAGLKDQNWVLNEWLEVWGEEAAVIEEAFRVLAHPDAPAYSQSTFLDWLWHPNALEHQITRYRREHFPFELDIPPLLPPVEDVDQPSLFPAEA